MIKINLLHSAVENTNLDVVESAISNKGTQQTLLLLIAVSACVSAMGLDWYITKRDNNNVKNEVAAEQATADRLQQVTKQAKELQDKNKLVEERINAIMRLRADQTGPLRLLQLMDGKLPEDASFRLTSLKQEAGKQEAAPAAKSGEAKPAENKEKKGEGFVISGYSPSEAHVIAFAKNMEFADGWFSKFNIEANRITNPEYKDTNNGKNTKAVASNVPKEVIQFNIRCSYNPQNLLVNQAGNAQPGQPIATPPQPAAAQPSPATKMP